MGNYCISNEVLEVTIASFGAEIKSIKANGKERMWNGDPKFWGRTAPVLFPFVGSVCDNKYRFNGKEYAMGQHGFARDSEFELLEQSGTEIAFVLKDSDQSMEKYPFHFSLVICYRIEGNQLFVTWKVENPDTKEMYFQVGGHPAFLCPVEQDAQQEDYELCVGDKQSFDVGYLNQGVLGNDTECMNSPITLYNGLFDRDALIIEDDSIQSVTMVDKRTQKVCLEVSFATPVLGIWSPVKKNAPFVCIEPWYGRCDREDFSGDLSERQYEQRLKPGDKFVGGYEVKFM